MRIGLCQRCKRIHFVGEKELCPECMDVDEKEEKEDGKDTADAFAHSGTPPGRGIQDS